ncbi:Gfo/Idh/MocA family protein [Streptomyces sp. NBC_00986]|uniref:Gfo/Idh/MocA family protein n=1 Tax=Streptomyces sp. NBC_00986 TaxID=2903702 RepID=UPI00386ED9E2|nr:Gfo/Idh/MocA family oxidoreductase [Streptomyces sp. NBC_00986]
MQTRTRWAVLGTGYLAQTAMPDLQRTENVEVVAVGSRDAERAAEFAGRWGIPRHYGSYETLLADGGFDLAYIATPPSTHAPLARLALESGFHTLVEKPFTLNADEAAGLADLAREHGRFLMEAMWTRFNPAIRAVGKLIGDGAIGEVVSLHADFGLRLPAHHNAYNPALGAGALYDLGCYNVALAHHVLGPPTRIEARGALSPEGFELTAAAYLGYPDSRFAQLAVSMISRMSPVARIGGTEGEIVIGPTFLNPRSYELIREHRELFNVELEGAGWVPMFREVSEAVQTGLTELGTNPLADSIAVMRTMDAIRRSIAAPAQ